MADSQVFPPDLVRPLKVIEREAIERAMILCRGDVRLAASRLQLSTATLYRTLRRWQREEQP